LTTKHLQTTHSKHKNYEFLSESSSGNESTGAQKAAGSVIPAALRETMHVF